MEKTFTFTLTLKQLEVVAAGLGELPGKMMLPVLREIETQFAAQNKPAETDAPPPA